MLRLFRRYRRMERALRWIEVEANMRLVDTSEPFVFGEIKHVAHQGLR